MKRIDFLTIFVNLWKRLESAVLAGQCPLSVKAIICIPKRIFNPFKKNNPLFYHYFDDFYLYTLTAKYLKNFK